MNEERQNLTRPTSEQIDKEIKRIWMLQETRKVIWGAVKTLLIFAAAAVLLSMLLFPVLQVQKGSMNPTLEDGEIIIFLTTAKIHRGDIVAFRYNNQSLIKRVIAVPGDRIDITDDGIVILNGMQLNESYISAPATGDRTVEMPLRVQENHYFVMGDHRETSIDSRRAEIGPITGDQIVGKAILRLWPLSKLGIP